MTEYRILGGDCIARMGMMERQSVDNVITDPPYEIGFMGKGWDNTGIAYNPRTWKAAHRVLKPNGIMLVFGATRTHHRIADAIQRAGFEIIDIIAWTYGTGFPKSHNISKAIDKRGGEDVSWFGVWLKQWRADSNTPQKEVSKLFPSKTGGLTGCVANWELGLSLPTNKQFNLICKTFNLPFKSMEDAKREVVGQHNYGKRSHEGVMNSNTCGLVQEEVDITIAATTPAKKWEGWGTALKPAWEPIIIARKKGSSRVVKNYSQFHYIPKAGKKERNLGLEEFPQVEAKTTEGLNTPEMREQRGREAKETIRANTHPTVKPVKLMKALVEEFTEKGSTVFDPFTGSGTTGMAAVILDRDFIGCELTPEYIPLAKTRIQYAKDNKDAF